MTGNFNIIIADTSAIVANGLAGILLKSGLKCNISVAVSFEEIQMQHARRKSEIIVLNPFFLFNNLKAFNTMRNQYDGVCWIGLIYAHYDQQLLTHFNAFINISDTSEQIVNTIQKKLSEGEKKGDQHQDVLSEREVDVLKLLATGMANKEIADKLNISTNTVITHRKNISQKTGIKSISGLTIYAVVKKLINLENITE